MARSSIRGSSNLTGSGHGSFIRLVLCLLAAALLSATGAWAKPTTAGQAKTVVMNWLGMEAQPMRSPLGGQFQQVQTFTDAAGNPTYYVVYLDPAGLAFVPADDMVEPIIGFMPEGVYDPSPATPLGALVSRDIPGRVVTARQQEAQALEKGAPLAPASPQAKAQNKWARLASPTAGKEAGLIGISDVRVDPLVLSKWDQAGSDGSYPPGCFNPCYNYYTPPGNYVSNNGNNYYCGCPATAMAQLLRYWQYPASPVGIGTYFPIIVNGSSTTRKILGGGLSGGAYDWANMVLDPKNQGASTVQCQAIGALTADAGVSVNTDYASDGSGVNDIASLAPALINTFRYSNAMCGSTDTPSGWPNIPTDNLYNMVNPNLDAQYPVLFAIWNDPVGYGHVIVGDGYGYSGSTMYHHLNMGWSGQDDAWYNLPNIDTSDGFNTVDQCIYNVYKTGSGEIISGRVTDAAGHPLSGVTVTATAGGNTYQARQRDVVAPTTSGGVYAIPKVPSNTTFTVTASKKGYKFSSKPVTTDVSVSATYFDHTSVNTGNVWGVDFAGTKIRLPAILELLLY